jgi:hypothetical protein
MMKWCLVITVANGKFEVTMAVPTDDTLPFGRQASVTFEKTAAPNFWINSTRKMQAAGSSKMLVTIYKSAWSPHQQNWKLNTATIGSLIF